MKEHIDTLKSMLRCAIQLESSHAIKRADALRFAIERLSNQERIAAQTQQWQPIETAPKTSKAILVWTPENRCVALVCWDKDENRWVHFYGVDRWIYLEITHWMPTPIAPDEALGKTEIIGTIDGFIAGLAEIKDRTEHRCDQCAELEDLLADIKPDADSDASGTLVERVEALLDLAKLDTRHVGTIDGFSLADNMLMIVMEEPIKGKAAIGDRVTLIL